MMSDEATGNVLDILIGQGVPHMLVGALAVNVHGIQRSTKDADIVIELGDLSIRDLVDRLGPEFRFDPQSAFESVTGTTKWNVHLNSGFYKIELFRLGQDPHDQERFRRRQPITFLGRSTWVLTAEDVIVTKLRWLVSINRSKDKDDVRNVLAVKGNALDWDYLYQWCDQHDTRAALDEIRQSLAPS
jgi:hypothetical protein